MEFALKDSYLRIGNSLKVIYDEYMTCPNISSF